MTIEQNIARFEAEVGKIDRPGIDKLMDYDDYIYDENIKAQKEKMYQG